MSLQVWLPLNGDLQNKGLDRITTTVDNTNNFQIGGKIGSKAIDVNGHYIFTVPSLIKTNIFSVSFWYKPVTDSNITTNQNKILVFNTLQSDLTTAGAIFRFQSSYSGGASNTHAISIHNNVGEPIASVGHSLTKIWDTWHHIVAASDGEYCKTYCDGQLIRSSKCNGGVLTGTVNLGYTGTRPHGLMNDLRLYDHCLSLKQIKELSKGLVLHYPLDNNGLGKVNPNLLRYPVSNPKWTLWGYGDALREKVILEDGKTWIHVKQQDTNHYDGYSINPDNNQIIIDNTKKYTISCLAKAGNKTNAQLIILWHWRSTEGGANLAQDIKRIILTSTPTRISCTLPQYTHTTYNVNRINIMMGSYKTDNEIYFTDVKFEQGIQTTHWIPHTEDPEYAALGYNDTTIYDCSGYQNNGTVNDITYSTNTPKYSSSSQFTSVNTSYIKINENNWMAQYIKQMTINLWAYAENWANQTKLFSCTQSGGFNTQPGNSGYIRFPIYVCTNQTQTAFAYKYDSKQIKISDLSSGWHMFTFIYEATTGTRTYIDGQLHHIYNNISYGIIFNTNARLFLGCQASGANPSPPYFNGKQSDFRLYYTVLSEEDIKELYSVRASGDRNSNFYSSGKFIEQGYSNQIEYMYNLQNIYNADSFYQDEDGLHMQNMVRITHDYISINPTGKTYKYDITYSNDQGSLLYIGWQRYDADKTSRSNNACVYVIASSEGKERYRIQGTVNLSTDGVNPCAFIKLRILNKWTGSASDTTGKATIHSLSLKEISSSDSFIPTKVSKQGNTYTTELLEKNNININISRSQQINANLFIEN